MIDLKADYTTRDGRQVVLFDTVLTGDKPIHGATLEKDGNWEPRCWHRSGRHANMYRMPLDLIEVPTTREFFVNFYEDFCIHHLTKQEAEDSVGVDPIAIAVPVTFEVRKT